MAVGSVLTRSSPEDPLNNEVLMRFYRSILLVSSAAWFMIGLHVPALHQYTHHGTAVPATVLGAIVTLIIVGVLGLSVLMRAPARRTRA
jgi:hypothetical protein